MNRQKSPVVRSSKKKEKPQQTSSQRPKRNLKQQSMHTYFSNKIEEKGNKKDTTEDDEDDDQEEDEDESSSKPQKSQSDNEDDEDDSQSEQKQQQPNKRNKRKAAQKIKSYKNTKKVNLMEDEEGDDENNEDDQNNKNNNNNNEGDDEFDNDMQVDEEEILEKLPRNKKALEKMLEKVEDRLQHYKDLFFQECYEGQNQKSNVQDNSIPICSDIRYFNWQGLKDQQMRHGGKMFDVIMMDPPWQLSTSQPSRGVAIAYDSLGDDLIQNMPIPMLQNNGYIFIWAINAKYRITVKIMEKWGYKLVDEVAWVKKTVNGKIAKGHGFYLQHAKESCLIGVKGDVSGSRFNKNIASDVIFSERRGQSQKPTEIYEYAEQLVPNGFYLEIFGRRNNLRGNWVTIGNEL